jgi:Raf kinase inhibitor-like YbhB/YbcL family protein
MSEYQGEQMMTNKMMATRLIPTAVALLALTVGVSLAQEKGGKGKAPAGPGLTLTSPDFTDGGIIPNKFTQGDPMPVSPKLEWTHVPAGVVSFTLIFHDPDAAPGKNVEDVLHWMAFNIPGTSTGLAGGQSADATLADGTVQGKNRGGRNGFMGPGAGAAGPYHHYTFELYALDTKLTLGPDASRADVLKAMDGHVVGKAALEGLFHR